MRPRTLPKAIISGLLRLLIRHTIRRMRRKDQPIAIWEDKLPPVHDASKNSSDWDVANISTQRRSPFFTKLPAEIRDMIHAYVYSEQDPVIELVDKEIKGKRSKYKECAFRLRYEGAYQLFAFAKTCKLAYVNIPYHIILSRYSPILSSS
jgi:hypothetical protein